MLEPRWVALTASRGMEESGLKLYMRTTVIWCDLLVYIPAVLYFAHVLRRRRPAQTDLQTVRPWPTPARAVQVCGAAAEQMDAVGMRLGGRLRGQALLVGAMLLQPPLLLIDHGHFQYALGIRGRSARPCSI